MKWCLQGRQSRRLHGCFAGVKTARLTASSSSGKNSPHSQIRQNCVRTVSCGFPLLQTLKDDWQPELRGGSRACFGLFRGRTHGSCQRWCVLLMLSVLDRGQCQCFDHAQAKPRREKVSGARRASLPLSSYIINRCHGAFSLGLEITQMTLTQLPTHPEGTLHWYRCAACALDKHYYYWDYLEFIHSIENDQNSSFSFYFLQWKLTCFTSDLVKIGRLLSCSFIHCPTLFVSLS